MVGTTGSKFPAIRQHFEKNIGQVYRGLDLSFKGFPDEDKRDPEAYKAALKELPKGSAVIIFTPDSTRAFISGRPCLSALTASLPARRRLPHR